MKIVLIGGTGLVGTTLGERLRAAGHEAVPAAPSTGVDTLTGEGLAEVLAGADVVVDVSNSPSFEAAAVLEFFRTSTSNLLAAEAAAGVRHHVALSVVGTQRLPESGYFRAKIAQEQLIEGSTVPYSLVHATQFFEFVAGIVDSATDGSTVRLAHVLFQPMAADDVAAALRDVAVGAPTNTRVDIAGPERFRLDDLGRRFLAAHDDAREVVTDPGAPYFGARLEEDTLVPLGEATLGATRFEDWAAR
jgi:uncharacterized protein YbjT (DUF2867 family)